MMASSAQPLKCIKVLQECNNQTDEQMLTLHNIMEEEETFFHKTSVGLKKCVEDIGRQRSLLYQTLKNCKESRCDHTRARMLVQQSALTLFRFKQDHDEKMREMLFMEEPYMRIWERAHRTAAHGEPSTSQAPIVEEDEEGEEEEEDEEDEENVEDEGEGETSDIEKLNSDFEAMKMI
ncbi:unnamed protein product [Caenorhabditis bovis]|uniref:Uncharacterized protein n=1 Tax=Caenorhabditis bovis TaxID=2654633 RepID=A0A8S1FCP4_9PELO|nr:unnamed protein product [Caenorhabditis bovis]